MLLGLFSSAPTPQTPNPSNHIQPHPTFPPSNDGCHGWSKKLNGHSTSGVWKLRVEEWTGTWRLWARVSWWLIVCSSCWRKHKPKIASKKWGISFRRIGRISTKKSWGWEARGLKIRKIRWAILATCFCYNLDMHFFGAIEWQPKQNALCTQCCERSTKTGKYRGYLWFSIKFKFCSTLWKL